MNKNSRERKISSERNMDEDDLKVLVPEQQRELMAAQGMMSDLDLAFRLQMEEAINASIALQPSTSSSTSTSNPTTSTEPELTPDDDDDLSRLTIIQTLELEKFQQERKDREQCEAEMNKLTHDLNRSIHDQKFAREILSFPEEEWLDYGDDFEKPFGEGSSSSSSNSVIDEPFRLYFRGLVSEEIVKGSKVTISAIGAAICDPRDNLILKVQKPLIGDWRSHRFVEVKALIEGLHAALSLNVKNIVVFIDYFPLFKQVTGRWNVKQRKMEILINQVSVLQKKFTSFRPVLLARNDVKFAIKLARDAIDSQITRSAETSHAKNVKETCNICLEDTEVAQMFAVDGCLHRYCFSCMKQHVEVKLLHGIVPACPHEKCKTQLIVDSCKRFLTPKFVEMMTQRIKEASVPVTEKIYCPYPKCSALMSKSEIRPGTKIFGITYQSGARKCIECHGLFCINCKVPWHGGVSCVEYKRLNPRGEEAKLKFLASEKLWRQCVKCSHMIELAEGCYHMTCRCGYEFCYTCGAEWKNKKATCTCPLWDEENILHDDFDSDSDYEEDEYNSEDEYNIEDDDDDWEF